jgi:cyclophilin family peptidyl-prolyl cis-trans isomerase
MAAERTSTIEMSGLEDAFEWLKARKNVLVGSLLVFLLALAVIAFVRRQAHESAVQPWRALFSNDHEPWTAPSKDLDEITSEKVKSADAIAYAEYWRAVRRVEEGDRAEALTLLEAFRTQHPDHPLVKAKLFDMASGGAMSAIDVETLKLKKLQDFETAHPMPTANPPAPKDHSVTLVTDRGPIVLALYTDVAPKSCEAFQKLAASLKDAFIAKTTPSKWIDVGHTEAGSSIETKEFTQDFPPFEENALHHFAGAVSFRQPPFSKPPYDADLRIALATDFTEDGRSTVFAQVTEGLELLTTISKEERKSDAPQVLVHPVKLVEVKTN